MNHIEYGKERDKEIVRLITQGGAFTRRQLEPIICPGQKAATRIIQRRLTALEQMQMVKTSQNNPWESIIYFIKRPRNIYHTLLINEVYAQLMRQRPDPYKINFDWGETQLGYDVLNGMVYADARIDISTPDWRQVVFLEVERSPSRRFDKVEKYGKVFSDQWYDQDWAVVKNDIARFPTILIVTDEELKIRVEKPRFVVLKTQEVKSDVYTPIIRKELM